MVVKSGNDVFVCDIDIIVYFIEWRNIINMFMEKDEVFFLFNECLVGICGLKVFYC